MNTLFAALLALAVGLISVEGCGSKNIECLTNTTFRFCFFVGNYTIYMTNIEMSCSNGKVCDENDGDYACINSIDITDTAADDIEITSTTNQSITTTTIITSTVATVTAPDCSTTGAGKFAAQECYQYYECTQFLWWYNLDLYTCDSGTAFDSNSQACVTSDTCVQA